jgi:hypothetical protein
MQLPHVFHEVGLQLGMNLTVSNAQILLNKLNKSKDMLVRNLFGKGKRRKKIKGRIKVFEGKRRRSNTQNKEKIILYYIKNNIILG